MQDGVYAAFCHITLSFLQLISITTVAGSGPAMCFTCFLNSGETKKALKLSPGGSWSYASKLWQATLSGHARSGHSLY